MYWKNKKVLITGHEGFLGSNLTKEMLRQGAKVWGLDIVTNRKDTILTKKDLSQIKGVKGNVANFSLVSGIIVDNKIEVIFHLAAEALVERCLRNPLKGFSSNIKGTWSILEAARKSKNIKAVIIASSDKAYGSHKKLPYHEDYSLIGNHPYDVSKSCADLVAYTYYHTYKVPVAITRCGNIFGPGDFNFSRIVPDIMRAIIKDKTLIVRSDGKFTRDYVYVVDIVNGYILLAEKLKKLNLAGEAFNFSAESPISVLEVVKRIYKLANKKADYRVLNKAKYEIKHQYLSSVKARRILGWNPKYSLDRGIKETLAWYKANLK